MNILLHNHSSYPEVATRAAVAPAIAEQESAGVDVVTDGRYDFFWRYLNEFDGVGRGEVLDLEGFRCARPIVEAPLRYRAGSLGRAVMGTPSLPVRRKSVMPGPYSLARLAKDTGNVYANVQALASAFAEEGARVVAELAAAGVDFIQVEEPSVLSGSADFRLLRRLFEPLWEARGRATLIVSIRGKDAETAYAQLNTMAADCLAIDLVSSPRLLPLIESTGAGLPLVLGICDAAQTALESAARLAHRLEAVFKRYPFEELHLQPSGGLAGLPRIAAKAKLQLLGQVRELLLAPHLASSASEVCPA